jgi:hypothetical protein
MEWYRAGKVPGKKAWDIMGTQVPERGKKLE